MDAPLLRPNGAHPPDVWAPVIGPAAPRKLCTDCGVSRMAEPQKCGAACQFIKPNYESLEAQVHGRARDALRADETHFGPFVRMARGRLDKPSPGAQWSGVTTRIAELLLERNWVDAVLTVAPDPEDKWRPQPVIVTQAEGMKFCRGMRMGYAPLLSLLEPAIAKGNRRLAVIGIPCQVYALRALETQLGLESLFVIGTPCSDNVTTENFHTFLALLDPAPETITYLEFRTDYRVELRYADGRMRSIPFLQLPLSDLPADFFPLTCRTCVDYTNVLSDITVGYMGGDGEQWLIVRNEKGERLMELLGAELRASPLTSSGDRRRAVAGFLENTRRAAGGLALRRAPKWLRPVVSWIMERFGPRGLEFARARVEMKAVETILHLRRQAPRRMRQMVPPHIWRLAKPYGLQPESAEDSTRAKDHGT